MTPCSYKSSLRESRQDRLGSTPRKRVNSMGKIYSTFATDRKEIIESNYSNRKKDGVKKSIHELINYDEMEQKLSNYLTCTIKTNSKQKYNYLS